MTIISSLLLDDSPLGSSVDVLRCSPDGQIALVTRGTIYIVTPDLDGTRTKSESISQRHAFGWTKTAIHEPGKGLAWSEGRSEWRILSLGTVETVWQAISWSPSGLNKLGGCLLTTLTNNMEVAIWAPVKNPQIGEWVKLVDITQTQIALCGTEGSISTENILKCQTCSIAWSNSRCGDGVAASDAKHDSLLALGSRSGDVNFFLWDSSTQSIQDSLSCRVFEAWVTRLAWSKWRSVGDTESNRAVQAYLACGLSNGAVWLLTVEQTPDSQVPYSIAGSILVVEADSRSIAAMIFVEVKSSSQPRLAVAKPGFITLCSLPSSTESESGMAEDPSLHTVLLSSPRTSLASSAVSTCTGMHYVSSNDCLIVTLAEGSVVVISDLSQKGHILEGNESPEQISTANLSNRMRQMTENAEGRPLDRAEYARIHGVQFIGTGNYLAWAQEILQPYDLSFRIQAYYRTRICVVKLWDLDAGANTGIEDRFSATLSTQSSLVPYSPTVLIQQVIYEMLDSAVTASFLPRVLPLLAPGWNPLGRDAPSDGGVDLLSANDEDFTRHIHLKLSLALFLLNQPGLPSDLASQLQLAHDTLVETATALRIQAAVKRVLALRDISSLDPPSVLRLMHAAQFCPVSDPLEKRFLVTREQAQDHIQRHKPDLLSLVKESDGELVALDLSKTVNLGEKCPACGQDVLFGNLGQARCQMGHVWERCATSLQLMSGIGSLTCSGCKRKSLDFNPRILAEPGTYCVLCGGRYFRVL